MLVCKRAGVKLIRFTGCILLQYLHCDRAVSGTYYSDVFCSPIWSNNDPDNELVPYVQTGGTLYGVMSVTLRLHYGSSCVCVCFQ